MGFYHELISLVMFDPNVLFVKTEYLPSIEELNLSVKPTFGMKIQAPEIKHCWPCLHSSIVNDLGLVDYQLECSSPKG